MIQLHYKGAMPAPSSSSCSLLFTFLVILLKVIHLSMWTSSRPDTKQQCLNLTTLFSLIPLRMDLSSHSLGTGISKKGTKGFQKFKGMSEMHWWNTSWWLQYPDPDPSKQLFHWISTARLFVCLLDVGCLLVCFGDRSICNGESIEKLH